MPEHDVSHYDVVVVGGGPAGSSAAYTCRQRGLATAVVDQRTFPRDKLCGGLFTRRALQYYKDVFGDAPPSSILIEKTKVSFWHNGNSLGLLTDFPSLFLTMRLDLDYEMFQRAIEIGAVDYSGVKIDNINFENKSVLLSNGKTISFSILIGADGVNSLVARKLFGSSFERERIGFGLEIEIPNTVPPVTEPVRIDFSAANWGYGWSFPKRKTTTVGVGGILSKNPDMKGKMAEYLRLLGHPNPHERVKGHFIPFGSFRSTPGSRSTLLCGDAAGLVDPITGEGIAYAIKSGQYAGESAAYSIHNKTPEEAILKYKAKIRGIHKSLRIAKIMRPLLFAGPFEGFFESAFKKSTTLKVEYLRLLAGEVEYPGLAVMLLLRFPKALYRTFTRKW